MKSKNLEEIKQKETQMGPHRSQDDPATGDKIIGRREGGNGRQNMGKYDREGIGVKILNYNMM